MLIICAAACHDKHRRLESPLYLCFMALKFAYNWVHGQLLQDLLCWLGLTEGTMLGATYRLWTVSKEWVCNFGVGDWSHLAQPDPPLCCGRPSPPVTPCLTFSLMTYI